MENCIFCRIVKGELPCYRVYEDEHFLGFLDIRPLNPGNALLIPKEHYRWVNDVPNFGDYWQAAGKVASAAQKITGAESVGFLTLGYEVPHAHIRIVPRFPNDGHNDGIRISAVKTVAESEMKRLAEEISSQFRRE